MNTKKEIISKLRKYLCAILLLFCGTNMYAGYENSYTPFENSYPTTNNNTGFLSNSSSTKGSLVRDPFDSNSSGFNPFGSHINKAPSDFGDRPGDGDGIGQVPTKDSLIFLILLAITYGLLVRRYKYKS